MNRDILLVGLLAAGVGLAVALPLTLTRAAVNRTESASSTPKVAVESGGAWKRRPTRGTAAPPVLAGGCQGGGSGRPRGSLAAANQPTTASFKRRHGGPPDVLSCPSSMNSVWSSLRLTDRAAWTNVTWRDDGSTGLGGPTSSRIGRPAPSLDSKTHRAGDFFQRQMPSQAGHDYTATKRYASVRPTCR
jgi:hypothetical protein